MDKKFQFFSYSGSTGAHLFKGICESPMNNIKVLDFMGVNKSEVDIRNFTEELKEAIMDYRTRNRENIPLMFMNLNHDITKKILLDDSLHSLLSNYRCIIPIFDNYCTLSAVMGISKEKQLDLKNFFDGIHPCNRFVSTEILFANPLFFKRHDTSYIACFSKQDLINDFTDHIIKVKLTPCMVGHIQISHFHVLKSMDPSYLFSNMDFNAWCARVIRSKFHGNNIDVIVYSSTWPSEIVFQLKREFIQDNIIVDHFLLDIYKILYSKRDDLFLRHLKGKRILILEDMVITGKSLDLTYRTIKKCGGIIKGIAVIFKNSEAKQNYSEQFYTLAESTIELYSLIDTFNGKKCPECVKTGLNNNATYLNPKNYLFSGSASTINFDDILSSNNNDNRKFWKMVKKSKSLKPHIDHKTHGSHCYYNINISKFVKECAECIDWDIQSLYDGSEWPDSILFFNEPTTYHVVSHLINKNKNLRKAILLPIHELGMTYEDHYKAIVKKLRNRKVLIVLDTIENIDTLERLLNLYKRISEYHKDIKLVILINRLPSPYRTILSLSFGEGNTKSIYNVFIPTFKNREEDCPICREIRILEKYYEEFSHSAKRYIDRRLKAMALMERDTEDAFVTEGIKCSDLKDAVNKGEILNLIYRRTEVGDFFKIIKSGISVERFSCFLEDIPLEQIYQHDIRLWLKEQIEKTINVKHLIRLLQATLHCDPFLIKENLDKIIKITIASDRIDFISYFLEYLLCEGVVSKPSLKLLLERIEKELSDNHTNNYLELFNSVIHKYPEQIFLRRSLCDIYNNIIRQVAATDINILIRGETGTGKEEIAKIIHDLSDRRDKPLNIVNLSSFPETLIDAELFGHEKGAFTGADRRRDGKLKSADGGTVFLDEIGDIPVGIQIKLLRALENKEFNALGS